MNLDGAEERGQVEDRRGMSGVAAGGGILVLIIGAVAAYFGIDQNVVNQVVKVGGVGQRQPGGPAPKDGEKEFSEKVLGTINSVWRDQFTKEHRRQYSAPGMVLFRDGVKTDGCGNAPSSVGPFYCPADKTIYVDPTFYNELESKLQGSRADFSKAYIIAHEAGHHVQNLLGYNRLVEDFRKSEGENAGIRLELQADYLAGVWAYHADNKYRILQRGDIESAITTAKAIGDDRLQKRAKGWSSPESFNHGTSDQRLKAFSKGLERGDASKAALDYFFKRDIRPLDLMNR